MWEQYSLKKKKETKNQKIVHLILSIWEEYSYTITRMQMGQILGLTKVGPMLEQEKRSLKYRRNKRG